MRKRNKKPALENKVESKSDVNNSSLNAFNVSSSSAVTNTYKCTFSYNDLHYEFISKGVKEDIQEIRRLINTHSFEPPIQIYMHFLLGSGERITTESDKMKLKKIYAELGNKHPPKKRAAFAMTKYINEIFSIPYVVCFENPSYEGNDSIINFISTGMEKDIEIIIDNIENKKDIHKIREIYNTLFGNIILPNETAAIFEITKNKKISLKQAKDEYIISTIDRMIAKRFPSIEAKHESKATPSGELYPFLKSLDKQMSSSSVELNAFQAQANSLDNKQNISSGEMCYFTYESAEYEFISRGIEEDIREIERLTKTNSHLVVLSIYYHIASLRGRLVINMHNQAELKRIKEENGFPDDEMAKIHYIKEITGQAVAVFTHSMFKVLVNSNGIFEDISYILNTRIKLGLSNDSHCIDEIIEMYNANLGALILPQEAKFIATTMGMAKVSLEQAKNLVLHAVIRLHMGRDNRVASLNAEENKSIHFKEKLHIPHSNLPSSRASNPECDFEYNHIKYKFISKGIKQDLDKIKELTAINQVEELVDLYASIDNLKISDEEEKEIKKIKMEFASYTNNHKLAQGMAITEYIKTISNVSVMTSYHKKVLVYFVSKGIISDVRMIMKKYQLSIDNAILMHHTFFGIKVTAQETHDIICILLKNQNATYKEAHDEYIKSVLQSEIVSEKSDERHFIQNADKKIEDSVSVTTLSSQKEINQNSNAPSKVFKPEKKESKVSEKDKKAAIDQINLYFIDNKARIDNLDHIYKQACDTRNAVTFLLEKKNNLLKNDDINELSHKIQQAMRDVEEIMEILNKRHLSFKDTINKIPGVSTKKELMDMLALFIKKSNSNADHFERFLKLHENITYYYDQLLHIFEKLKPAMPNRDDKAQNEVSFASTEQLPSEGSIEPVTDRLMGEVFDERKEGELRSIPFSTSKALVCSSQILEKDESVEEKEKKQTVLDSTASSLSAVQLDKSNAVLEEEEEELEPGASIHQISVQPSVEKKGNTLTFVVEIPEGFELAYAPSVTFSRIPRNKFNTLGVFATPMVSTAVSTDLGQNPVKINQNININSNRG